MSSKARQQMRRIEIFNHLGGHNRIKQAFLFGDQVRVAINTQLVEERGGQLFLGEPHIIGTRLPPHHIQAMGLEKTAEGAIATDAIKKPGRLLSQQKVEERRMDVALRVCGLGCLPAVPRGGAAVNAHL